MRTATAADSSSRAPSPGVISPLTILKRVSLRNWSISGKPSPGAVP